MSGKRVFQSTLPRGERHPLINIHIIAHGFFGLFQILSSYFNPRSREGSDCRSLFRFSRSCDFNPRSREGSDVRNLTQHSGRIFISIHAPARGATLPFLPSYFRHHSFQSTLPRGERLLCGANLKLVIQFQSTLPRGERRNTQPRSAERRNFNPRSREGSDDAGAEACYIAAHFNPRSREGSDLL